MICLFNLQARQQDDDLQRLLALLIGFDESLEKSEMTGVGFIADENRAWRIMRW